jgi:hypothetical protein
VRRQGGLGHVEPELGDIAERLSFLVRGGQGQQFEGFLGPAR